MHSRLQSSDGWVDINTDTGAVIRISDFADLHPLGVGFTRINQTGAPDIGIFSMTELEIEDGVVVFVSGQAALAFAVSGDVNIGGVINNSGGHGGQRWRRCRWVRRRQRERLRRRRRWWRQRRIARGRRRRRWRRSCRCRRSGGAHAAPPWAALGASRTAVTSSPWSAVPAAVAVAVSPHPRGRVAAAEEEHCRSRPAARFRSRRPVPSWSPVAAVRAVFSTTAVAAAAAVAGVVIEAGRITLEGLIAANGGGGGAGADGTSQPGANGHRGTGDLQRAAGGAEAGEGRGGGRGGAGSFGAGESGAWTTGGANDDNAGGGGGAAGRIRLRSDAIYRGSGKLSPAAGLVETAL